MEKSRKILMKTYKFRLYPSEHVEQKMFYTIELCRQTYNILLGELQEQKVIDRAQIQGIIPDLKICDSRFKRLYSKTMQYECYRLFSNLRALAQTKKRGRNVGSLRFKQYLRRSHVVLQVHTTSIKESHRRRAVRGMFAPDLTSTQWTLDPSSGEPSSIKL